MTLQKTRSLGKRTQHSGNAHRKRGRESVIRRERMMIRTVKGNRKRLLNRRGERPRKEG